MSTGYGISHVTFAQVWLVEVGCAHSSVNLRRVLLMSATPEVWIVGVPGSGRNSLIHAVIKQPLGLNRELQHEWLIDNKYYTAATVLKVLDPSHSENFSGEAVVVVFNASDESSFEAVKAWTAKHDTEDAGVRLAVATHADELLPPPANPSATSDAPATSAGLPQEAVRPAWLDAAIEHFTLQCFEYIECCSTDPEVDALLRLDGDIQGIARILDALHSHMWPGLTRKAPNGGSTQFEQQTSAPDTKSNGQQQQQQQQPTLAGNARTSVVGMDELESEDEHEAEAFERMLDELMSEWGL